ncbi:hypothetical protein CN1A_68 [Clavibacter phage CN1A]|uniref:Uncharacterized protein n=1 Tax=Clavibacter phage CN1A TaxID=1406793 RepID=U5PX58_9CAUD|nr:hypothetical protein CN1A_68 [Clavibacter phage CN1A]AGY47177.1 hypothetical protein CN1A_68 [Clavibacter phage CN1A]
MKIEDMEPLLQLNTICLVLAMEIGFDPDDNGQIEVNLDDLLTMVVARLRG